MADGTGRLRYDDRDVHPGERYGYRLNYVDGGELRTSAETWVEVPTGHALALEGFRPNPAVGSPLVSFTLPRAGPGRIELFDLAGRRVAERDLSGLPPGRHVMNLGLGAELVPGAYVVRLTHDGQVMTKRGAVVR